MAELASAYKAIRERSLFALVDTDDARTLMSRARLLTLGEGDRVPRGRIGSELHVVVEGSVGLCHPDQPSEIVGRVSTGRSVEIQSFLKSAPEWKFDWVADRDSKVLILSGPDFRSILKRRPNLEKYLQRVANHPELQKLKNDLRLFGFSATEIRRLIESLESVEQPVFGAEAEGATSCLVVVKSGELELDYDYEGDKRSVGRFSSGDYFHLSGEVQRQLTASSASDAQFWRIDLSQWLQMCNPALVEGFIKLIDPLARRMSAQEEAARKRAETPEPSPIEEVDDGLTVKDFEVSPANLSELWDLRRYEVRQQDEMDCGAACLTAVARFWGRRISIPTFRGLVHVTRDGASMLSLKKAADTVGFKCIGIMSGPKGLMKLQVPFIALMQYHFVVVFKITADGVELNDPGRGLVRMSLEEFKKDWSQNALLLKPKKQFFSYPESAPTFQKYGLIFADSIPLLLEILALSVFIFFFGMASPLFMQFVFDNVLENQAKGVLHGLAILMVGVNLIGGASEFVRSYLLSHLTSRLDAKFSALFMRHTFKLPLNFFAVRRVGDITTRLGELVKIREFFTGRTVSLVINMISIFLYCGIILFYSTKIFALIMLLLPLLVIFIAYMIPRLTANLQQTYKAMSKSQSVTFEHFNSLETLKSIHGLVSARWRADSNQTEFLKLRREYEVLSSIIAGVSSFFRESIQILSLLVAVYLYIRNELSLGQVVALNALVGNIVRPAVALVSEWNSFNEVGVSLARVDDIMTSAAEPDARHTTHQKMVIRGDVEFKNVSFQYGSEMSPLVLDGVSLRIKAGQTVAVVGGSGSGKTTLGYMLNLLYAPTKGQILIDGIDATEIPKATLRRQVAMIMQDNSLFSGSIIQNICVGDEHPSFKKAIDVARLADAHDFIVKLKLGYATNLGEGGSGLSGGQKQRINIARALYLDPAILVMDEATSALDAASEQVIVNNLKARENKRTTVIIAHRLNTVMHADQIVVLERGRIVEVGSHSELLQRQGRYFELFRKQLNL